MIDFDEALLAACPPGLRDELAMEAELLASALPAASRAMERRAMAKTLSAGVQEAENDRARARKLASALRRLARTLDGSN